METLNGELLMSLRQSGNRGGKEGEGGSSRFVLLCFRTHLPWFMLVALAQLNGLEGMYCPRWRGVTLRKASQSPPPMDFTPGRGPACPLDLQSHRAGIPRTIDVYVTTQPDREDKGFMTAALFLMGVLR